MEADSRYKLRNFTHARIAMGRAGNALPSNEMLNFRMSHALARDAVYSSLDISNIEKQISLLGLQSIVVESMAENRNDFLLNPNKGRQLNPEYIDRLSKSGSPGIDLCIILGDGLSANAVNLHAVKLIELLSDSLKDWQIAPVIIAQQARVALSDTIGELLKAEISLILIGERPGLSSPNSLGAYITYRPKAGNTDEKRNCVSNIQPDGLNYQYASVKIAYLLSEMNRLKLSGVQLKDNFDRLPSN